jgi:hypothetical protein
MRALFRKSKYEEFEPLRHEDTKRFPTFERAYRKPRFSIQILKMKT